MPYTFLSDEWLAEVKKLAEESGQSGMPDSITLNMVVTGGPQGDRELHVTGGKFESGLLDSAPTKLTVPYDVAKKMFVDGNQSSAFQAFIPGQIKAGGARPRLW